MTFRGIEIRIVSGSGAAESHVGSRGVLSETAVRDFYARALSRAGKKGGARVVVRAASGGDFSPVASAKILAQEIYRASRGMGRRRLREVRCVVTSRKIQSVFQKTLAGYLKHVEEVLTQGPFVTVDALITVGKGVVLVRRSNPPFGWALPGGFVDYGETLERAAAREAKEETGLLVKNVELFRVYSSPRRDPRFHTVSVVFTCRAKGVPRGASDAAEAKIFSPRQWGALPLAFDHKKILDDYLRATSRPGRP